MKYFIYIMQDWKESSRPRKPRKCKDSHMPTKNGKGGVMTWSPTTKKYKYIRKDMDSPEGELSATCAGGGGEASVQEDLLKHHSDEGEEEQHSAAE
eukprot:7106887-Karenia_brevis.AAC.1